MGLPTQMSLAGVETRGVIGVARDVARLIVESGGVNCVAGLPEEGDVALEKSNVAGSQLSEVESGGGPL